MRELIHKTSMKVLSKAVAKEMVQLISNNIFLTLQSCMVETITNDGSKYKVPYMGKAALMRQGVHPEVITYSSEVV